MLFCYLQNASTEFLDRFANVHRWRPNPLSLTWYILSHIMFFSNLLFDSKGNIFQKHHPSKKLPSQRANTGVSWRLLLQGLRMGQCGCGSSADSTFCKTVAHRHTFPCSRWAELKNASVLKSFFSNL